MQSAGNDVGGTGIRLAGTDVKDAAESIVKGPLTARNWIPALATQFGLAGLQPGLAPLDRTFPPAAIVAQYWDGAPVELSVPSAQMHFGAGCCAYLRG